MIRAYYDLHIHTCLSPCADDDMLPCDIVNMALLNGLDVIAITDHNSCKNARAAVEYGKAQGLLVLPGMELETSEEVHVVCLFCGIDSAEAFGNEVDRQRFKIKNRADIFGRQLLADANGKIMGEEETLLTTATGIGIYDVARLAEAYHGAAFLSHIDRQAHGAESVLGGIDPGMGFFTAELSPKADKTAYRSKYPDIRFLTNSDAHSLWQVSERDNFLDLENLSPEHIVNCIKKIH